MPFRLNNFDWDDLRYFLAIARNGTIRGGAQSIGANHATVARRIAVLEGAVDARLFDRSQAGLRLTQLGEELLPFAENIENEIASASRTVAGRDLKPVGPIRLSIPPFLTMSSIFDDITEFCKRHPDIEIHLQTSDSLADFDRREADVSVRFAHEVLQDVVGRRLVRCVTAAYCSPEYAAQMKDNNGEGLTLIGWMEDETATSAQWITDSYYPKAQLRHRVIDGHAQLGMAAAGAGLAVVPSFVADRHPGVIRAPFQKPMPTRSIWLLLHADLRKTARIRLFVDFLAERVLARRPEFEQ